MKYISVEEVQEEMPREVTLRGSSNSITYKIFMNWCSSIKWLSPNRQGRNTQNQEGQKKDSPNIGHCIVSALQSFFVQSGQNNWVGIKKVLKKYHSKLLYLLRLPWAECLSHLSPNCTNTNNFIYLNLDGGILFWKIPVVLLLDDVQC